MGLEKPQSVIITGGGYGIGRASARLMARNGWAVTVVDRDAARAIETCELVRAEGGCAEAVVGDVTQEETFARVVATARALAPIRGLVTCAAMRHAGSITSISAAQWRETLDVILNGVFLACKGVIPDMIANGGGSIINVSSPDAFGRRNMVAYASGKAAVNALSLCLAADHQADGVRVNVVLPGFTRTGMTEHYDAARFDELAKRAVSGRVAEPEDVAGLVCWLLSRESETFTGGFYGPQMLAAR